MNNSNINTNKSFLSQCLSLLRPEDFTPITTIVFQHIYPYIYGILLFILFIFLLLLSILFLLILIYFKITMSSNIAECS
jgi:hypothetical protein